MMNESSIKELEKLINENPDLVDFGTSENAVEQNWFDKAEKVLGVKLPESYVWFLKNYSGGEIGGEEVYSIYGMNFEEVNGGDIVYQHLINKKSGLTKDNEIVIMETDLDEIFLFAVDEMEKGEYPIYLRLPSGKKEHYATDMCEFLIKRIKSNLS